MTIVNRPPQPSAMIWDGDGGASTSSYATPGALITVGRVNYADSFALDLSAGGGSVLIYLDPMINNSFGRYHDLLINSSFLGAAVPLWPGSPVANDSGSLNDFRVGGTLQAKLPGVLELMVQENPHMAGFILDDVGSRSWFPGFDWTTFGSTNQSDYRAGAIAICQTARTIASRYGLLVVVNGTWDAGTLAANGGGYPTLTDHGNSLVDGGVIENHDSSETAFWSGYSSSTQWASATPISAGAPLIWVWEIARPSVRDDYVAADIPSHALAQVDRDTAETPWSSFHVTGLPRGAVRRNFCPEPVPTGTTAWISNRTMSVVTVTGFDRTSAARITGLGSGGEHYILAAPGVAFAGDTYTASISYRTDSPASVTAYILFYNNTGGLAGAIENAADPVPTTAGVVYRIAITGTAPSGTVSAGAQISLVSSSTATLYATMGLVEWSGVDNGYFDGATATGGWDGTPGASTSTLSVLLPGPDPGPTPVDLSAAIDSDSRVPVCRILVDWDRDGSWSHPLTDITAWVTDLSIEQSATGDLPTEASLVEGSIAGTLTATLGGLESGTGLELTGSDGLSALETFAPYRLDSPLAGVAVLGCQITADVGLLTDSGPQMVRRFTGQVRSLAPSGAARSVTLGAIDGTDLLRAPITLPTHSQFYGDVVNSNHKLQINSQAVVDFILRRNGYYASPAAIPTAQISCTGHGWLAAEVGRSAVPRGIAATITDDHWYLDTGPFGMLCVRGIWSSNGLYTEFFAKDQFTPAAGNGIGFGCWLRLRNNFDTSSNNRLVAQLIPLADQSMKLEVAVYGDGRIGGRISITGSEGFVVSSPATATPTWTYVGVHWQYRTDGTTAIDLRLNGATGGTTITTPAITSTVADRLQMTSWTNVDWACMQVWYDYNLPSGAWPGEVHTPTASVAKGVGWLTNLPDVVAQDSLTTMKAVVGAEFGLFGFSELNVPTFRSQGGATDPTTVDKTITADRSLIDLATSISVDSVRNVVSAETVTGLFGFGKVILQSKDAGDWQSGVGVSTFDVPLDWGAIPYTTVTLPRIASASWNDTVVNGYVSVQAASIGTEITSGITVTVTPIADRLVRITVRNYSTSPVRFCTTSGSPAFRVQGWLITLDPAVITQVTSAGSVSTYGTRSYQIAADPWRQSASSMAVVAGGLLAQLSDPYPVLANIPVVGDPTIKIGDCERLVDPYGQGSFRVNVVGIRLTLNSTDGLRSELTVRAVAPPGLGILDDDELGISDDTLILAP